MLSSVLNSSRAVQVNIKIMRALLCAYPRENPPPLAVLGSWLTGEDKGGGRTAALDFTGAFHKMVNG